MAADEERGEAARVDNVVELRPQAPHDRAHELHKRRMERLRNRRPWRKRLSELYEEHEEPWKILGEEVAGVLDLFPPWLIADLEGDVDIWLVLEHAKKARTRTDRNLAAARQQQVRPSRSRKKAKKLGFWSRLRRAFAPRRKRRTRKGLGKAGMRRGADPPGDGPGERRLDPHLAALARNLGRESSRNIIALKPLTLLLRQSRKAPWRAVGISVEHAVWLRTLGEA